ncbi:MAG: hypothetical protein AAF745_08850, partial [Planctomycetota bacterium]
MTRSNRYVVSPLHVTVFALLLSLFVSSVEAQQRISLTRSVEPSFRIEPVVQRYRGRRGERIPFKFELQSTGKAMQINIRAVALRQEETGIILHDHVSAPASGVEFTSPTEFDLAAGGKFEITGDVTVPLVKSNIMSFGILVRDEGQLSK